MTLQFRGLLKGISEKKRGTDWQGGRTLQNSGRFREDKRCSPDSFAVWAFAAPGCNRSNFVFVLKCNGHVSVQCGHSFRPLARNSKGEEETPSSSCLSSLVLHVLSVNLSVCFVSTRVVLLPYSRCCQSTSNLKRERTQTTTTRWSATHVFFLSLHLAGLQLEALF